MAHGFVQRYKGRITTPWGGIYQQGAQSVAAFYQAGAPTNGTSGTLANVAPPGALLVTGEPALYQNTNTQASPTWTAAPLTGAAGITSGTIDGTVIGGVTPAAVTGTNVEASGYFLRSVGNALTAVGTNRGTALQLAKEVNNVTTAATGTGVVLPVGVVGMEIEVYVASGVAGAAVQVYASGSETIDGTAGSTGVVLTKGNRCRYTFVAANTWISAQLGAVSA